MQVVPRLEEPQVLVGNASREIKIVRGAEGTGSPIDARRPASYVERVQANFFRADRATLEWRWLRMP